MCAQSIDGSYMTVKYIITCDKCGTETDPVDVWHLDVKLSQPYVKGGKDGSQTRIEITPFKSDNSSMDVCIRCLKERFTFTFNPLEEE